MSDAPAVAVPDGRAAHKARTRQAIVDAAAALMLRTAGTRFSVDELAAQAGVARRTVFNHFESLDDVVAAVGSQAFAAVLAGLAGDAAPPVPRDAGRDADPRRAMVEDLTSALRRADLVGPMAALTRGLGITAATSASAAAVGPHQAVLLLRALLEVGESLAAALVRRHPRVDPLDVELAVAGLSSGLVVLHRHWLTGRAATDDDAGRAAWDRLVDRLAAALVAPAAHP